MPDESETLEQWLDRMDAQDPHGKSGPKSRLVPHYIFVDGHPVLVMLGPDGEPVPETTR